MNRFARLISVFVRRLRFIVNLLYGLAVLSGSSLCGSRLDNCLRGKGAGRWDSFALLNLIAFIAVS